SSAERGSAPGLAQHRAGRRRSRLRPSRSLLDLAADHVDRVEDGDQVRYRVAFDQPRERGEDGEPGPAHLDGVGLALPVRYDVEAELAVRSFGVDVDLSGGHVDALH